MKKMEKEKDFSNIYELVTAIVQKDLTIEPYQTLCEELLQDPFHHRWLLSALMQKAKVVCSEPDRSCLAFLARKIRSALKITEKSSVPREDQLVEDLPVILEFVPEEEWNDPVTLWDRVLIRIQAEYGLPQTCPQKSVDVLLEPQAIQLALFFNKLFDLKGICQLKPSLAEQSQTMQKIKVLLQPWEHDANYSWLKAVLDSYSFNYRIEQARHENPLSDGKLFDIYESLTTVDKKRFIYFTDVNTEECFWYDTCDLFETQSIQWKFFIPGSNRKTLALCVQGVEYGQMTFSPISESRYKIIDACGFFAAIALKENQPLILEKAAAEPAFDFQRLSSLVRMRVCPVENNRIMILIRWSKKEKKDGTL